MRLCRTDDAMWVSDLPRHMEGLNAVENTLEQQGFLCRLNPSDCLWYIDWSRERWRQLLKPLPFKTELPAQQRYHAAYALCRLWLLHPAELHEQSMPLVRRLAKLCAGTECELLNAVSAMHETAAMHLRTGIPAAHGAGRMLAEWLNERR